MMDLETLVKAITQYIIIWVRYFPKDFDDYSVCIFTVRNIFLYLFFVKTHTNISTFIQI